MYALLFSILAAVPLDTVADDGAFAPEVAIEAGTSLIDIQHFQGAAPHVADFDGDGLHDLLVGQYSPSQLRIYRNVGTKSEPKFDDFEWFRVDGEIAELPGGAWFRPQLVDLNGDGRKDVVAGPAQGMIFWYARRTNGTFQQATPLQLANGKLVDVDPRSNSHFADWDDDDDLDLLVCGSANLNDRTVHVFLFENEGTPTSLQLKAARPLKLDAETPFNRAFPFVVDWDGDGRSELLISEWTGRVLVFERLDENASDIGDMDVLLPAIKGRDAGVTRGRGGAMCVVDWDGDDQLDFVIGDQQSEFVQPDPKEADAKIAEIRKGHARVLRDYRRIRKPIGEETPNKKAFRERTRARLADKIRAANAEIRNLEKSKRGQQTRHGFVWVIRGLPAKQ